MRSTSDRWPVLLVALALCGVGCAHGTAALTTATQAKAADAELVALRSQVAERDQRLNQLESRLALVEASQRELRYALADRDSSHGLRETVRIRDRAEPDPEGGRAASPEPPRRRDPERPVLRLHEEMRRASDEPLMSVPEVSERLPIAPVPPIQGFATLEVAPQQDPAEHYKRAIDLVRQREFVGALAALNDFLLRFPEHARASKVMFWRGEVLFAQRDYPHALEAFESSVAREPKGDKAADALLKIGLCHKRLGSPERARAAIERLKTQFPESVAARMAAEEDA